MPPVRASAEYDKIAETIRQIMLKRLEPSNRNSRQFAIACLVALVRDDSLHVLLFDPIATGEG